MHPSDKSDLESPFSTYGNLLKGLFCLRPLNYWASLVAQLVKNLPAIQETWFQSLGLEEPLKKGKATRSKYSGLENSMDYVVHGVAKSRTQLGNFHFTHSASHPGLLLETPEDRK